ncbi:hypothetical protein [Bradyrhizobium sp. STM 3566]|uniref:hypothetical protein n=1 Tax=Bradyrhizobium sp. STM 3566 TaxID=578928 RepID=UPI0038901A0E
MNHDTPASLFDDREALARDGETELREPLCTTTASKSLEADGTAWLAQHGDDANGNPLGTDGAPVASEDIMSLGKRVSEKRGALRPEFVSEAALNSGAKLHADPESEIDAKRRHQVAMHNFYISHTQPCEDAGRYDRIEAGLRLLTNTQSEFEADFILGAIRRDCKILGVGTPAKLAVAMGCSTSTVYTRMRDASLDAAILAIAAEKDQSLADARKLRSLKLDIRSATRGTVFDSPAWHREIERLYASLKYQMVDVLARETTLSRFDAQKGTDRALSMIPHSRLELLAELDLLSPEVCRMLGKMSEADRDEWIAERDAESLAELCGDADQRRKASERCGSQRFVKRIKAYLAANGRNPSGPVLPKPNTPAARKPKKAALTKSTKRTARANVETSIGAQTGGL